MYKRDFEAGSGFKTHLARQTTELSEEEKKNLGQAASVQRSAASPGRSLLQLQRQYGNRYVQRVVTLARATEGEGDVMPDVERAIESSRGGGQSLDSGVQAQMGQALNADFSGVRVHTDAGADGLNQSLSAKAFTTGRDIYFRQGEYNPGDSSGRELLAHELTHVVQQNPDKVQTKSDDEGSQSGCTCGIFRRSRAADETYGEPARRSVRTGSGSNSQCGDAPGTGAAPDRRRRNRFIDRCRKKIRKNCKANIATIRFGGKSKKRKKSPCRRFKTFFKAFSNDIHGKRTTFKHNTNGTGCLW